jgi:predicted RNase H-like HicB family nuclease
MKLAVQLYQDEDGVWIAEIPAIPGCGSEGKTREEALRNVQDAAELCISVRAELICQPWLKSPQSKWLPEFGVAAPF